MVFETKKILCTYYFKDYNAGIVTIILSLIKFIFDYATKILCFLFKTPNIMPI